jgi:sugar/nucleoside kinase (ribokinase family)
MADVAALGILVADVLGRPVDGYPERGKLMTVDEMTLHIGGCAANTGVGLARLGVDTSVLGKVGRDGFGDYVIGVLEDEGIGTRGIARDDVENTSGTMVMVGSDSERTFIHYIGANGRITPEDLDDDVIGGSRFLHMAGTFLMPGFDGEPAAKVLRDAKAAGVTTCCDTAWDASGKWLATIEPMLAHIDYFLPSLEEAREITGRSEPEDVAKDLLDRGVGCVALKAGAAGCHVWCEDATAHAPILPVDPIDANGAGDAFCAGFICGLTRGWDIERCAQMGTACGALCVTALGTTAGLTSFDETVAFAKSKGVDLTS